MAKSDFSTCFTWFTWFCSFAIFGLLPVFGLRSFARSSLFWPDLRSHPLPITSRMTHTVTLCKDSHSHTVQRLLKKDCFLRDINQKIFPILTVTNMSDNQWSQFVKKDSGFAFLAYWNDMLVRLLYII